MYTYMYTCTGADNTKCSTGERNRRWGPTPRASEEMACYSRAAWRFRCSPTSLICCNSLLQHSTVTVYCNSVLLRTTAIHYRNTRNTRLGLCPTPLIYCNTLLQQSTATVYCNELLQHNTATHYWNTLNTRNVHWTLSDLTGLLQHSTGPLPQQSLQVSIPTNCCNTTLKHTQYTKCALDTVQPYWSTATRCWNRLLQHCNVTIWCESLLLHTTATHLIYDLRCECCPTSLICWSTATLHCNTLLQHSTVAHYCNTRCVLWILSDLNDRVCARVKCICNIYVYTHDINDVYIYRCLCSLSLCCQASLTACVSLKTCRCTYTQQRTLNSREVSVLLSTHAGCGLLGICRESKVTTSGSTTMHKKSRKYWYQLGIGMRNARDIFFIVLHTTFLGAHSKSDLRRDRSYM